MKIAAGIFALLLLSGCGQSDSDAAPAPGRPDQGDWEPFYSHATATHQRQYFFDRSNVRREGDHLVGRWKIESDGTGIVTSLYVVRIECRLGTFTELGTVLIDDRGQSQEVPATDLFVDHRIEPNSSTAKFRELFCR
jgi:hypothetical protein